MIALIDGDILVYRIGFAADDVSWPICRSRVDEFLEDLLVLSLEAKEYEGFLTDGTNNFRNKIAVTAPYKGQRPGTKPVHYTEIRNYLVSEWGFKIETEQEADDAIGIRATALGESSIIVTIDKDLDNIPGWHYNFVKRVKYYVTDEEATKNFYRQILTGDRIDNVQGLRGIGPVKADRILDGNGGQRSAREYYQRCVDAYDGDSKRVIENGQLLWIRRYENEQWSPPTSGVTEEVNETTIGKSKGEETPTTSS